MATNAKYISVVSRGEKFRRAGIDFSRQPTLLEVAKLKPEQLKAIEAEPALVVKDAEPPKESGEPAGKGKTDKK